jgi:hypothetical protein
MNSSISYGDSTMSSYLYIAQLAISKEREAELNALYDSGYLPALRMVPGVVKADRFKLEWSDVSDMPEYLAVYELSSPNVPHSNEWKNASIACGWAEKIRPYLTTRRHGMFRRIEEK